MANTNCLEGMACPKCGSEGPFRMEMTSIFTIFDDGTDGYEDTNWDEHSYCNCKECDFEGVVKDFQYSVSGL